MFRPPVISEFGVRFEDRFAEHALDFFILQSTERYGYFEGERLVATVSLHAQRVGSPHRMDIRVLPESRGPLEIGLVTAALQRLHEFAARDVETRVLTSHEALVHALADASFIPVRGLTLMAKGFRN
jgi:hypothetical protein